MLLDPNPMPTHLTSADSHLLLTSPMIYSQNQRDYNGSGNDTTNKDLSFSRTPVVLASPGIYKNKHNQKGGHHYKIKIQTEIKAAGTSTTGPV